MSFRSALHSPTTNSGSVGKVIYGAVPSGAFFQLTSGAAAEVIDTITLGAGVWNINTNVTAEVAINTDVQSCIQYIQAGASILAGNTLMANTVPAAVAQVLGFSSSNVITLAVPTTISLTIAANFTVSLLQIQPPATVSGKYIIATKLA